MSFGWVISDFWLSWFPFFQWFLFPKPPKIGFGRVDLAFLLSASSYPFIASFSKTRREWNPDARSCFAGLFFPCPFQTPSSKLYAHEPELQALFISQIYCSFDFFSFPSAYGFESVLALEIIRSICGWPDLGFNVFLAPFFRCPFPNPPKRTVGWVGLAFLLSVFFHFNGSFSKYFANKLWIADLGLFLKAFFGVLYQKIQIWTLC